MLPNRRHFLKGTGACFALPFLETLARADEPPQVPRFVCMANPFGMVGNGFFPKAPGIDAALPDTLKSLEPLRGKFTAFSNLDHAVTGGHAGTHVFLSGVQTTEAGSMPNANVTVDQYLASETTGQTRFPVLNTSAGSNSGGSCELSWTRSGVLVPAIQKVSRIFQLLFVEDTPEEAKKRSAGYDRQGSILDAVFTQAKSMNSRLSKRDQEKLDQYLTSVREVESTIQQEQAWVNRSKPTTELKEPKNGEVTEQIPIMLDLLALALETDSTRVATIEIPGGFDAGGIGLKPKGYHAYSHHGKDPAMMAGQQRIETYQIEQLAGFLKKLEDRDILSSTQVLFGSGMGDGSAHTNSNLPILLAGGAHHHVTHSILPSAKEKRVPLSNLFLSIIQQFGIEVDRFGHSTGTLTDFS